MAKQYFCSELIWAECKQNAGWVRRIVAVLEEISPRSAYLQTEEPVPVDSMVRILLGDTSFEGKVQACSFSAIGYGVTIQFNSDQRWSPKVFRPQHLFDILRLKQYAFRKPAHTGAKANSRSGSQLAAADKGSTLDFY